MLGFPAEFSIRKARKAQALLAQKVITEDKLPQDFKYVAGVDAAYAICLAFGSAVVLNYVSLEVLEIQMITQLIKVTYVSTLLSFRELPVATSFIR